MSDFGKFQEHKWAGQEKFVLERAQWLISYQLHHHYHNIGVAFLNKCFIWSKRPGRNEKWKIIDSWDYFLEKILFFSQHCCWYVYLFTFWLFWQILCPVHEINSNILNNAWIFPHQYFSDGIRNWRDDESAVIIQLLDITLDHKNKFLYKQRLSSYSILLS